MVNWLSQEAVTTLVVASGKDGGRRRIKGLQYTVTILPSYRSLW